MPSADEENRRRFAAVMRKSGHAAGAARAPADEPRHRRAARRAFDPHTDARHLSDGRRSRQRRRIALLRRTHPGRAPRRACGDDHVPYAGDTRARARCAARLPRERVGRAADRRRARERPATVLFTDIVGSTEKHGRPRRPRLRADLLQRASRDRPARAAAPPGHRDGHRRRRLLPARFDGPGIAPSGAARSRSSTRCGPARARGARRASTPASASSRTARSPGSRSRSARVSPLRPPRARCSSRALCTYLVAGSGLRFDDRGSRPLKGVPGEVRACSPSPDHRRAERLGRVEPSRAGTVRGWCCPAAGRACGPRSRPTAQVAAGRRIGLGSSPG